MLTLEEAKAKTVNIGIPCYGEPVLLKEDEDFLYYQILVPKVVVSAAMCGPECGGCGTSCETEEE